jgi:hypothetical protein
MATEEQKKQNLLKVFNIAMFGLIEGLWDLFGESSFATINAVGDRILETMEKEAGLEISGENPEDILLEVTRLLVDEMGTMSAGKVTMDGTKVSIACQECFLREATGWLEAEGVQPFACVPMNISAAAMRKRLGSKHRVIGRDWNPGTQTCTIHFQLVR